MYNASTNHKSYTSLKGGWMLPKQTQPIVFNQWFPEGPKPKPSCIYWDGCWDVANHWLPKIAQKSTKKDRFSTHEEILRLLGSLVHQEKHIYMYIYIHIHLSGGRPVSMQKINSCFANCHMTETKTGVNRHLCDMYIYIYIYVHKYIYIIYI